MQCKHCGASLSKSDCNQNGILICPGCGAKYRIKTEGSGKKQSKKKIERFDFKNRKLWIGAAAALLCVVLIVVCLPIGSHDDAVLTPESTIEATATPEPVATATPEPTAEPIEAASVHFRAVGDVMCHNLQLINAKKSDGTYSFLSQFYYIHESLENADYTIANLECSISVNDEYYSYPRFRTPVEILDALQASGVDFLTLANNHILDGYYEGLEHTLDEVDARGFDHIGAYRSEEERDTLVIKEINGIKFGFVAYTYGTNGNEKHITDEQRSYCVDYLDDADFEKDVQALRDAGAEVVIALPHWGQEYVRYVRTGIKNIAKKMVAAGVDIILASHPHVVLPIEQYHFTIDGEEKDILIAWSMGNFLSNCATQYTDSGIIVDFTVSRDETGKISIHDVGYVPVYVWGTKKRFHVLCSGDFYYERPDGMRDIHYDRLKASVKEIVEMIGTDGISLLQN